MIDVKEVLRRWSAGQSARQMAREGVVSRRTATRYIEAATSLGLSPSTPLTDEAVQGVAQCVQARPTPAVSDPRQLLEAQRIRIEKWLQSLITRSKSLGEHIGLYAERLLAGPLPWIKMRQGYGLIRLCERYGAERVDALCKRSLAFDVVDVPRIDRMLKQAQTAEDTAPAGRIVPLPTSRFARDPASFATRAPSSPKGR
ncbi:MAG TPA: hypothetical protein VJN18_05695 [Polyangiaceae bacterium]|nr:hypothetical protein [Polyangiaceae bacterium]